MTTTIAAESTDAQRPYAHLQPIVDALLANGNVLRDGSGWHQDRDGWRCDLRDPIDFALVRERFALPKTIRLSPADDAILCEISWIEIAGPGKAR